MSQLLKFPPYGPRDDTGFLQEMNDLTRHHWQGCLEYQRIFPGWKVSRRIEEIPFLHVGLFKNLLLKTTSGTVKHERMIQSSSTSGISSKVFLDQRSSAWQAESSKKILIDFVSCRQRPLLVLDSVKSLMRRGELSARIAAAMSLKPLAIDIQFLLDDSENPDSFKYSVLQEALGRYDDFLIYGFSWILWLAWAVRDFPPDIQAGLRGKRFCFVHSGGWKKLEDIHVDHHTFNKALLKNLHAESKVVDYFGLVEQMGVIFPLCEHGSRHVPVWADVLVRDSHSLKPLEEQTGQLQFLNTISLGAPYHSVLTEDLGRILPGACPCGRHGRRFMLLGRVPKAEVRGCANV